MTPRRRDGLAMTTSGFPGLDLDPERRDMLRPGPTWMAEVETRRAEADRLKAVLTLRELLAGLTVDDRRQLAGEALHG